MTALLIIGSLAFVLAALLYGVYREMADELPCRRARQRSKRKPPQPTEANLATKVDHANS